MCLPASPPPTSRGIWASISSAPLGFSLTNSPASRKSARRDNPGTSQGPAPWPAEHPRRPVLLLLRTPFRRFDCRCGWHRRREKPRPLWLVQGFAAYRGLSELPPQQRDLRLEALDLKIPNLRHSNPNPKKFKSLRNPKQPRQWQECWGPSRPAPTRGRRSAAAANRPWLLMPLA